ncbi:hypothetical protein [Mucilaginibacter sp. SG564]|uniref:hypothetical protein n=1 Tax=Mucilaginibacter sp. SG564 TaxID=2587022 RepID=UPI001554A81C|nr:hypothetical protein [Mucilaginibacter sp. SG564]NOW95221.1 hypothetical protein [Mucilaginibacter sp. SG564]
MKRGVAIFWMLYMLFFAIPFPMLLYYNIKSENPLDIEGSDPWLSLGLTALSMVLWIILLAGYYRKWVLKAFSAKRNMDRLKKNGVRREAKILESVNLTKPDAGYNTYELSLSFKNLANTEIVQKAGINDMKPYERRFEVGKRVGLLIDKEMKHIPYFIFENSEGSIRRGIIALINLGWLLLLTVVVGYYIYSYQSESEGMGWRFMSFGHPLLICPAVLLFYRVLLGFISSKLNSGLDNAPLIKFKGVRTTAKQIAANLTGTYINEQPMVNFELEFVDYQNHTHRASIKKIVSLLDLDSTKQKTADIFYLQDDPQKIAFATDLDEID